MCVHSSRFSRAERRLPPNVPQLATGRHSVSLHTWQVTQPGKEGATDTRYSRDGPGTRDARREEPGPEGRSGCAAVCVKCPEEAGPRGQEVDSGVARGWGRGWRVIADGDEVSL